jgi:hypothetical protein
MGLKNPVSIWGFLSMYNVRVSSSYTSPEYDSRKVEPAAQSHPMASLPLEVQRKR